VVSSENQNTSGGSITLGDGRYQLRVPGEFKTPEEIYGLVITSFEGRPIYLKDLARVKDGFKEETSRSRLNGREAVNISVKKRAGENIIAISDQIDELIERRKPSWPKGTQITKLMDQANWKTTSSPVWFWWWPCCFLQWECGMRYWSDLPFLFPCC